MSGKNARVLGVVIAALCVVLPWAAPGATKKAGGEKSPVRGVLAKGSGVFVMDFDSAGYRAKKFPGYCVSYAVFRNAKKARPLYVCGRGSGGTVTVSFDALEMTAKNEPDLVKGEAKVALEFADDERNATFFRGEDWREYACGEWVKADPSPVLEVTIRKMAEWKALDEKMATVLDPDRKRPPPGAPPETASFAVKADMGLRAGDASLELKGVECRVGFSEELGYWRMRVEAAAKLEGSALGLTGEDAGAVTMKLVIQAFSAPPKGHTVPSLEDVDGSDLLKLE